MELSHRQSQVHYKWTPVIFLVKMSAYERLFTFLAMPNTDKLQLTMALVKTSKEFHNNECCGCSEHLDGLNTLLSCNIYILLC